MSRGNPDAGRGGLLSTGERSGGFAAATGAPTGRRVPPLAEAGQAARRAVSAAFSCRMS